MAYAMTKQGSLDNCVTYEFICDTIADMNAIQNRYRTIGSVAIVLQGESEGLEVYIAGSNKNWNSLSSAGANSNATGGLSIYICGQDEIDELTGLPDVEEPDETSIYLVPAGETSGNLYEEYIYVDEAWEKFGSASIDLSGYAPIANPNFTDSVSLDRYTNSTVGTLSVALGRQTQATGNYSFAEGNYTTASGSGAHAEGQSTVASAYNAHAEGLQTKARGNYSHAEGKWDTGNQTTTYDNTTYYYGASGAASHSEGANTIAHGDASHAEGNNTKAIGSQSHAEGNETTASGMQSHAEGQNTLAEGMCSHAEGYGGTYTVNNVSYSYKAAGMSDHVEGYLCLTANGQPGNHAEGYLTKATGGASHSEGAGTVASGTQSHAEGGSSIASGTQSHAEGYQTIASGLCSHSEGTSAVAVGTYSHAEGAGTQALGAQSHAEGGNTIASGSQSHTEGIITIAIGANEHVSGKFNITDSAPEWQASTSYQIGDFVSKTQTFIDTNGTSRTRTVIYKCKTANSDSTFSSSKWEESGIYAEIIGNGTADNARSNARALDWNGNEYLKGDIYINCNADSTGGTAIGTLLSAYESRIAALEAEITSLRLALTALATEDEVVLENGAPLTDEQGNLIEYDTPTT